MNKTEFLDRLAANLAALPRNEAEKSLAYYAESIDDRMEDGMTEEEAVAGLGSVEKICENIYYDLSIPTLMKAKVSQSKSRASNKGLWLALVILGLPLWLPLLAAFAAVVFAVYITVWAVIFSLYAVLLSLGVSCIVGIAAGIVTVWIHGVPAALCLIGMALVCGALTLFMIAPVLWMTRQLIRLTAYLIRQLKRPFIKTNEVSQ